MIDDIQAALEAETGSNFLNSPKTYLGDGVYAFHNGFEVVLATVRGRGEILHWISLDPAMIASLSEFLKRSQEGK